MREEDQGAMVASFSRWRKRVDSKHFLKNGGSIII
jgi:hypothetical protein